MRNSIRLLNNSLQPWVGPLIPFRRGLISRVLPLTATIIKLLLQSVLHQVLLVCSTNHSLWTPAVSVMWPEWQINPTEPLTVRRLLMVMWSRRLSAAVRMLMWRRSLSPGPPAGFGSDPSRRSSLSLNPISVYRVLVLLWSAPSAASSLRTLPVNTPQSAAVWLLWPLTPSGRLVVERCSIVVR